MKNGATPVLTQKIHKGQSCQILMQIFVFSIQFTSKIVTTQSIWTKTMTSLVTLITSEVLISISLVYSAYS